jgi:hypothetical protein
VVLTWPMMVAVQSVCARIGRVTGHGLAGNMVQIFPRPVVYVLVGLLLAANTINIGADLAAMGAAAELVVGGPAHIYTFLFAVVSLLAVVFVPYHRYVNFLKWTTFSLFAYVGVVFAVHIDWRAVAVGALLPRFALNGETITLIVAIFGTTISPYLFFWQSSQEVEEEEADPEAGPLLEHPEQASRELGRIGWETLLGMAFSNLIAFFIILTTAVTLNANGQTDIQTSAQAAAALRPVQPRHHRHRPVGRAGAGGLGRLRRRRDRRLDHRARAGAPGGVAVLCRDRHRHPARRLRRPLAARSDQGADLERGAERRDYRADDGGDHDRGIASRAHGRVRCHPRPAHSRLAHNGHDDHRLDRHVPVDVTALAGPAHT